MLVLAIAENLDKLFEDGGLAAITSLCELGGVVIVTVDHTIMLIVAILCSERRWAHRASEMFDVIFAFECCDVGSSQSSTAIEAKQIQAAKVVGLAERILAGSTLIIDRKEFRCHNLATILRRFSNEISSHQLPTWQLKHSR